MRCRLVLALVLLPVLVGAKKPESAGCRAPWNPPEIVAPPPPKPIEHAAYAEPIAGRPVREWIEALSSENNNVRKDAAFKLGQGGAKAWVALPALIGVAENDADTGVRSLSAEAMGKIGPRLREVVPTLNRVFRNDPAVGVRTAAARALSQMGVVPDGPGPAPATAAPSAAGEAADEPAAPPPAPAAKGGGAAKSERKGR